MAKSILPSPTGYIYFIRAGRTANVKVGWAKDPYRRLDQLQTASPHTLHLIGYAPGDRSDEDSWHALFGRFRVRGEWFHLDNYVRGEINRFLIKKGSTRYIHIALDRRRMAA